MTSLESILGKGFAESTQDVAEAERTTPDVTEATGVQSVTTPSGIEVYFQAGSKREYRVRYEKPIPLSTLRKTLKEKGEYHHSPPEWQTVPSVTEILKVLHFDLGWWGMKIGVDGMTQLLDKHLIGMGNRGGFENLLCDATGTPVNSDDIVNLLTQEKLTVNHVRNKAGDRGVAVHDALEQWATQKMGSVSGYTPDPEAYPEEQRGYITGLANFLQDSQIVPLRSEVMVGSVEHGYAGRYDLDAYTVGSEVVTHQMPTKEKREVIEPGLGKFDLKTKQFNGRNYPAYDKDALQLAAYEEAAVECGYEPTDFQAVVYVFDNGKYHVKQSYATFYQFLKVKEVSEIMKEKLI